MFGKWGSKKEQYVLKIKDAGFDSEGKFFCIAEVEEGSLYSIKKALEENSEIKATFELEKDESNDRT